MTDKNIKRYQMEVEVEDSGVFMQKFDQFNHTLTVRLRDDGYVPLLDLPTFVTVDYKEEHFHYVLTVQAVFVGKKRSWHIAGILHGREVLKSTPENKSNQS